LNRTETSGISSDLIDLAREREHLYLDAGRERLSLAFFALLLPLRSNTLSHFFWLALYNSRYQDVFLFFFFHPNFFSNEHFFFFFSKDAFAAFSSLLS